MAPRAFQPVAPAMQDYQRAMEALQSGSLAEGSQLLRRVLQSLARRYCLMAISTSNCSVYVHPKAGECCSAFRSG